jgi:hypothetical protein
LIQEALLSDIPKRFFHFNGHWNRIHPALVCLTSPYKRNVNTTLIVRPQNVSERSTRVCNTNSLSIEMGHNISNL